MRQKTFNIGEYCYGGTIKVKLNSLIKIQICEYKTDNELIGYTTGDMNSIVPYLCKYTSIYYADKVYNWILKNNEEIDPTPYCSHCGAKRKINCNCGPIAENN